MALTLDDARARVAAAHPDWPADQIARAADDMVSKLERLDAEDRLRAAWTEAQAAAEAEGRTASLEDLFGPSQRAQWDAFERQIDAASQD